MQRMLVQIFDVVLIFTYSLTDLVSAMLGLRPRRCLHFKTVFDLSLLKGPPLVRRRCRKGLDKKRSHENSADKYGIIFQSLVAWMGYLFLHQKYWLQTFQNERRKQFLKVPSISVEKLKRSESMFDSSCKRCIQSSCVRKTLIKNKLRFCPPPNCKHNTLYPTTKPAKVTQYVSPTCVPTSR